MQRSYMIVGIIVVAILAIFPTPRAATKIEPYTTSELGTLTNHAHTLDCSRIIRDGNYWRWGLTDMNDDTKFVVDIESTEDVRVELKSITGTFYDSTKKIHSLVITRSGSTFDVTITNPTWLGTGPSAVLSGDIKVYRVYEAQVQVVKNRTVEYTEWLPWWMP